MAKHQIVIFMLSFTLLCGCGNNTKSSDKNEKRQEGFYNIKGGWDWISVPLLKPYEVKKIDPEIESSQWAVTFERIPGATNVKSVTVDDSIIYLLCGDSTLFDYQYVKAAWFVIDTKKQIEKGFANELEFRKYLQENKYPTPNWNNIDSLSEALSEGNQVPWIPK